MEKTTIFSLVDEVTGDVFVKNVSPDSSFIKSASKDNLEPAIKEFIDNRLKPKPGKSYLLINAMGASDYFGENLNADWFYEETLKNYHKTFEQYGHSFRHHINKDPKIAEGRVIFSHYNDKMKRVELVTEVDSSKVKDILERLDKGETVATSMACKVSKDKCSICGNEAKRREDYCIHLKGYKRKIHTPSSPIPGAKKYGQKVYAINPDPKFFDISFVRIPADSTSSVLMKIAEAFSGEEKSADIVKEVKTHITEAKEIDVPRKRLPKKLLKKIAETYSVPEAMTTMINMNMFPTRSDFQYLYLKEQGHDKIAELLYDSGVVFPVPSEPDDSVIYKMAYAEPSDKLANDLLPYAGDLGIGRPVVLARIMEKNAEELPDVNPEYVPVERKEHVVNTIPYLLGVGGAYYGYNRLLDRAGKSGTLNYLAHVEKAPALKNKLTRFLYQRPGLFAAGLLGAGFALNRAQEAILEKQSAFNPDSMNRLLLTSAIVAPTVFLAAAGQRRRALDGEQLGPVEQTIANNPKMTAAVSTLMAAPLAKFLFTKRAYAEDFYAELYLNHPEEFEQIYKETMK